MKHLKTIALTLIAFSLLALTGCKNLTPQGAASLTTLAVYEYGKDNPKAVRVMRDMQPLACGVAMHPEATVEQVVRAIQLSVGVGPDTKEILNVILAIYQTSVAPVATNTASTHPYLQAVICDGWSKGLEILPQNATVKGAPPVTGQWHVVK